MRRYLTRSAIGLCLLLMLCPSAPAAPGMTDIWFGLFLNHQKAGYSHSSQAADTWRGRSATRFDSVTHTVLTVLGMSVEQDVTTHAWADAKTGAPLYETFEMSAAGTSTKVDATFYATHISAVLTSGGETTPKDIPLTAGEKISLDDSQGIAAGKKLTIGTTDTEVEFDPLTLSVEIDRARVVALNIPLVDALDGRTKSTAKVEVTSPEGDMTVYQDEDANPMRMGLPAGIVMLRISQKDALADTSVYGSLAVLPLESGTGSGSAAQAYQPSQDLAVATAVSPSGASLGNERTCTFLKVRIVSPGQPDRIISIQSSSLPPPHADSVADLSTPSMRQFLANAPYLSLSDADLRARALQIRGDETNSFKVVLLVHDWVDEHMTPLGTLGIPRSASDVLANPVGVCRDYAVLYTALARACGIPTRLCAGLVGFHGRFYYHAWAESYLGKDAGWLAVDPTMSGMFVDATHVALGKGDPLMMYSLSSEIGTLKVTTLSVRNSL